MRKKDFVSFFSHYHLLNLICYSHTQFNISSGLYSAIFTRVLSVIHHFQPIRLTSLEPAYTSIRIYHPLGSELLTL